jgi:hypothetical protein
MRLTKLKYVDEQVHLHGCGKAARARAAWLWSDRRTGVVDIRAKGMKNHIGD